ncbi:23S rRNA (guanosine(2251)-2'-O)-methyltransferase RlmB [Helicobacter sp. faydin-H20]|uniref:23S rRNA (guanosine(2251)-2'-O)-methyltransferase RlmB n=1 Tax=Helicobacter anatolicus TaxID=2905874 RepID=UPI001E6165ED|nr:23S rRNA (guanosine(2251)-2'-O)-methyltransferase RlmB [Helicobacter anatolicus]MCE3036217.1 23S rRNA (guanosine(2251)-2'-O)-methyltransferase RlmB [Helicobacter anatolicus]
MIVFGKQTTYYIIQQMPEIVQEVYFSKEMDKNTFHAFARLKKPIIKIDNKKAQALSKNGNHQGYFLKIKPLEETPFKLVKKNKKLLVLCGITDVGNIGSIMRSAYCLGIEGVILCGIKQFNIEGVLRTSVGAILHLPFCVVENVLDVINELKNEKIFFYGADMNGEDVKTIEEGQEKWALFLGSENQGLNSNILSKLDRILSIKMQRSFNSLNVGVAAGILIDRIQAWKY